ncbi:hypothetical protein HP15_1617 [Marinobacter adhaerens HP15]|uniref:Uncharacterized protein n=1 Tax=Marinobacter adhaerens (strain DSM 23420 / HP15) TaxID=225937 RepID=E4PM54_MARAH|nr:hypothetical protein HP15_1617 [Marinobacter adhaerens HP15]
MASASPAWPVAGRKVANTMAPRSSRVKVSIRNFMNQDSRRFKA